jgi:hypothetical protein
MMNKELLERAVTTNKERNGGLHNLATTEVRDKAKKATKEKYGVEYPLQSAEIVNKIKVTMLNKYGKEYYIHTDCYYEYMTKTFGYPYPLQNVELFHKQQKTAFSHKLIECPDGKCREFQGYEFYTYLDLLEKYTP